MNQEIQQLCLNWLHNCHCNEKSGWLFRQAAARVGTGRGRIAGRAAL